MEFWLTITIYFLIAVYTIYAIIIAYNFIMERYFQSKESYLKIVEWNNLTIENKRLIILYLEKKQIPFIIK